MLRHCEDHLIKRCFSDPYVQLLHYRRALRFLKIARKEGAHVLVLGTKYQNSLNFGSILGNDTKWITKITPEIITNASKTYDIILCLDPPLYAKQLYNVNLPCVAICSAKDLYRHRDISDAFDYFVPLEAGLSDSFLNTLDSPD